MHFSIPDKVILKDRSRGIFWNVDVNEDEDAVVNGWQEYLKDNCIEVGEFLVFWYDGMNLPSL